VRIPSAYPNRLRRAVIISAVIHIIIFSSFSIIPGAKFPFREKPIDVTWVELPRGTSEEIGMGIKESKTLPRSTIEEQKQLFQPEEQMKQTPLPPTKPPELAKAPEENKTQVEPRPKMQLDDKNAKVRRADEPPKTDRRTQNALAKIDKLLKDRTVVPETAQTNMNSEGFKYGTSNKPLKVPPSDPEYLKYQATVRYRVMREWIVPQKYTEEGGGNYNARLEVLINLDGEVTSIRWASHSGNESFDQSAMRAIKKASPFPKPPDRLAWEAYNEGFLIEFDPRIKVRY